MPCTDSYCRDKAIHSSNRTDHRYLHISRQIYSPFCMIYCCKLMLPGESRHLHMIYHMFAGSDLYYDADPAQPLTTAGEELQYVDHISVDR